MARNTRRPNEAPKKVRFAVVGQGHFAQSAILPGFAEASNSELVALFSDDPTKLETLKGTYSSVEHALGYDAYDDLLRSGAVDAVYVALPNDLHCEYTVRAAAAGVHVLCEKPMAVTSEEAERMIAACRDAKVKLMIAYRLHFEEANLATADLVASGQLGRPRYFTSAFSMQVREGNIRTRAARGGGPLFDIGVYCINAARYVFRAEPTEVLGVRASADDDPRFGEVDEQVSAVMKFPEQRLASFTVGFGAAKHGFYDVVCAEGRVRLDPAYAFAEALQQQVTTADGKTRVTKFKKRDQIAAELGYFAGCILEDQAPEPSGEEGLADLRVIEALGRSLADGRPVRVEVEDKVVRPSLRQERAAPAHAERETVHVEPPGR